jgi:hypothetical protein
MALSVLDAVVNMAMETLMTTTAVCTVRYVVSPTLMLHVW